MNQKMNEKLLVEKILYLIIRNNKKLFDDLPEIDANPQKLLTRLQKAIQINGGADYLVKLAKQTYE